MYSVDFAQCIRQRRRRTYEDAGVEEEKNKVADVSEEADEDNDEDKDDKMMMDTHEASTMPVANRLVTTRLSDGGETCTLFCQIIVVAA